MEKWPKIWRIIVLIYDDEAHSSMHPRPSFLHFSLGNQTVGMPARLFISDSAPSMPAGLEINMMN
jgi:hypothetical protein